MTDAPDRHQAEKNEANPEQATDITFTHNGHEYSIPADAMDDVEIVEMLEDEKTVTVVRQILGKEQWDAWKDRNRGPSGRISAAVAEKFLTEMFEAMKAGNFSASSST